LAFDISMQMMRAYFFLCRVLGRLLRAGKYSKARIVYQDGERLVRKHRSFYAPLLIWIGGPLMTLLDTGVRVLPQRDWEARERLLYRSMYGTSIRIDTAGPGRRRTLVLPCLAGESLATLLEDPRLEEPARRNVIERAVAGLSAFHRLGFTHGDAMAENVMIDVEAGVRVARWFDFETVHEADRPMAWRRADDVRALMMTCLIRTAPARIVETVQLILDSYADDADKEVIRVLATNLTPVFRRSLTFHLAQAGLSFQRYMEVVRLLSERVETTERV
jgi:serine/threonine protein kinase